MPYKDPEKERERERKRRQDPKYRAWRREYEKRWGEIDRKRNPDKYKEYAKRDYQKHKEKRRSDVMKHYCENREKRLVYNREYYFENMGSVKAQQKVYRKENWSQIYERMKKWVMDNSEQFLRKTVAKSMRQALRVSGERPRRGCFWEKQLGFDVEQLRQHLESQFQDDMTWDNYGSEWHIDHIRPVSSFKPEEFKECWSLDNLQPLWTEENLSKGARR